MSLECHTSGGPDLTRHIDDTVATHALPSFHCQKSKLLCTLIVLVIFRGRLFELFKLHGIILFFFAKFFCTQVNGRVNGRVIWILYLQDKLIYKYEKL